MERSRVNIKGAHSSCRAWTIVYHMNRHTYKCPFRRPTRWVPIVRYSFEIRSPSSPAFASTITAVYV